MTSGTFTRVRLFTDIEDITLDKWLDAENAGQDDLAKKILDAGLLVEHMIAEIPLDQNLTDNSELRELTESADRVFGLVVCFGCNRAFQSKNDQTSTCPNCGAKLSRPELTPTNLGGTKKTVAKQPEKEPTPPQTSPKSGTARSNKKQPRKSKKELQAEEKHESTSSANGKNKKPNAASHPKPPSGPSTDGEDESSADDEDEGWFGSSTNPGAHAGKHGVKSH